MAKKLTKVQAIQKLKDTRSISTDMLEPLGYSFESFLRLAQYPKADREALIAKLIAYYDADAAGKQAMAKEALARRNE